MTKTESSTCSSEVRHVPASRLPGIDWDERENRDSCQSIFEQFENSCSTQRGHRRAISSGKTYQGRLVPSEELRSDSYSRNWMPSGTVWHGAYSMRSLCEYPTGKMVDSSGRLRSAAGASFLSEVLEVQVPQKYSLSAKACAGIIRRTQDKGRELPPTLLKALKRVVETEQ